MTTIIIDGYKVPCEEDMLQAVLAAGIELAGDDAEWARGPDEEASAGSYKSLRWDLGEGRSLYVDYDQGVPDCAAINAVGMAEHLQDWDWADDAASLGEWMAQWGYEGLAYEQVAGEDYEGPCRVWREPNYYQGTYDAPQAGYARDDEGDVLEFDTRAEAQAYCDDYFGAPSEYEGIPACNVLAHGQAGADALTVVNA